MLLVTIDANREIPLKASISDRITFEILSNKNLTDKILQIGLSAERSVDGI